MFFDFDIISLTFFDGEDMTVISVVSSPIDIINPITPPTYIPEMNPGSGFLLFFAIIIIIILIIILWPVMPQVLGAIWWAIKMPFKAIGSWIKNSSNKPKKPKDPDSGGGG